MNAKIVARKSSKAVILHASNCKHVKTQSLGEMTVISANALLELIEYVDAGADYESADCAMQVAKDCLFGGQSSQEFEAFMSVLRLHSKFRAEWVTNA